MADSEDPPRPGIAERALAAASPSSYLDALNPEQRLAVETLDGPVLVLAGAGTGKTRVLTTRIAHILATRRAWPSEILAVTFTNKAAREMRERIGKLIGGAVEGMAWLGTFHSIGVKILRRHAELVGLKSNFTILDTDDQIRLMKQVIEAGGIDEKRWTARLLSGLIDRWKNRGLTPKDVPPDESFQYAQGRGAEMYAAYQARLKTLNAADFGDLLLECLSIFRAHNEVLSEYQKKFKFILVDEYQDTNVCQYLWLMLLAQNKSNICCVGDDDQAVYGWRGAEVDNILRFESNFSGSKVIRLEHNYRSTSNILATASHLISHNESRLGKTLRTTVDPGEKIVVRGAWDSQEEARMLGEAIEQLQRQNHSLNEIAILVRASFQMREFEDRFVTLGLNYRVIGGPRFYERQEIRDALAYFRVVAQPFDDLAFERIVNLPRRGLGDATMQILHNYSRLSRIPLSEAARIVSETEELKPKPRKALNDLMHDFARWRSELDHMRHTELGELILEESGYIEMWRKDKTADAPGRLENLKELIRSMEEFENLGGFLEHISLVMDAEGQAGADAVSIMTLHGAKGLEFDTVFLPGWEEALFPHPRALDENGRAGLEEERRLAYVGLTRARLRAQVSFAANRRIHGVWNTSVPSRFINELPEAYVTVEEGRSTFGGPGGYGASRFETGRMFGEGSYSTPGWRRAQANAGEEKPLARRREAPTIEGELVAQSTVSSSNFKAGDRVFHQKFGSGTVRQVEGNKLTVLFDATSEKKVLESFVDKI